MITRIHPIVIGALLLLSATVAQAQDVPTLFLHGFNGSADTWAAAIARLESQLEIAPQSTDLPWQQRYGDQAAVVQSSFRTLPARTIVIGHSNGGVVAREWSRIRTRALAGIVTLGTPHQGVPILKNLSYFTFYNEALANGINGMYYEFSSCLANPSEYYPNEFFCPWANDLYYGGLDSALDTAEALLASSPRAIAETLGLTVGAPVFTEMMPGSAYLTGLNSTDTLPHERSLVGTRIAIVSQAYHWDRAGYLRLWLSPQDADAIYLGIQATAALLDAVSGIVLSHADPYDTHATGAATQMNFIANQLRGADGVWCNVVTNFRCEPNDIVVPESSQGAWDDGVWSLTISAGPVHTREAGDSDATIIQALTNLLNVPPRPASDGGGGSGGGSSPYVGCFTDDGNRALPVELGTGHTIESCIQAAAQSGYAYAGLQYYGYCFAGNAIGYAQVGDSECNTPCDANSSELCGGVWRNSIFVTGSSSSSPPPPPPPPDGYYGCYSDTEQRALPADFGPGYTIESCRAVVRNSGYAFAGLQYGGYCFGGSSIGYDKLSDGACDMPCAADPSEICGAAWRNSIYSTAP
ncbi:MAG TPA: WSC domain-containing protein [Vicinamibacterales bacterium]|nr:WSC domain-containing protein [Vicinamibacterales bacterium]